MNESRIDPKYKNGTSQYKDVLDIESVHDIIVASNIIKSAKEPDLLTKRAWLFLYPEDVL